MFEECEMTLISARPVIKVVAINLTLHLFIYMGGGGGGALQFRLHNCNEYQNCEHPNYVLTSPVQKTNSKTCTG